MLLNHVERVSRSGRLAAIAIAVAAIGFATPSMAQDEPAKDRVQSEPVPPGPQALDCTAHTAQGPAEAVDRRAARKARRYARKAGKLCKRHKYEQCAAQYLSAFATGGDHQHLVDLARAYTAAEKLEPAICAYQQYLASTTEATEQTKAAQTAIAELQDRRAAASRHRQQLATALTAASQIDCSAHAWPSPAEAPSHKQLRQARKLTKKADRSCKHSEHADCIRSHKDAFAMDGDVSHLDSAASAYKSLAQNEAAICAYRQYVQSAPTPEDADAASQRMAEASMALSATREQQQQLEQQRTREQTEIGDAIAAIGCSTRRLEPPGDQASRRDKDKALALVNKAQDLCLKQQLEECIEALTGAYRLDGDPINLYSIAVQYTRLPNRESAICVYDQFLSSAPPKEYVEPAQASLLRLSEQYNNAQAEKAALEKSREDLEKTSETLEQEARAREEFEKKAKQTSEELEQTKAVLTDATRWIKGRARSTAGTTQRYVGTGLLGVGALGVGMGVLYALDARHTESTIESASAWGPEFDALMDHGQTSSQRATIFTAVGGAALVGGAVLYWLGERASRNVEVEVEVPQGAGDGVSVRVLGTF